MAGGGNPQLPYGLVPVSDDKKPSLPNGLIPIEEKKNPIGNASSNGSNPSHDFNKGYQPTPEDIKTRQKFIDQENSFDKPPVKFDLNVLKSYKQADQHYRDLYDPNNTIFKHGLQVQQQAEKEAYSNGKSWKNIGTFTPRTIFGNIEKDIGDAATWLSGQTRTNPMSLVTDAVAQSAYKQSKKDLDIAQKNQLPGTEGGKFMTGVSQMGSDIVELAATPEMDFAKAGKLAKPLKLLLGKFPVQQGVKGLVNGYADAIKDGKSEDEANAAGYKGLVKGAATGALMEAGNFGAGKLTGLGSKALEDAGLMADNKLLAAAEKRLVHATAQGITFSAIPLVQNAMQGKSTSLDEMRQQGTFGAILGALTGHGEESKGDVTDADKASAKVIAMAPVIDLHNFMNTEIPEILDIHKTPVSEDDLRAVSTANAEQGFKSGNDEEKQNHILQSSIAGKAASVKSITDAILNNKDALLEQVNQLPEEQRQPVLDKIEETHKQLLGQQIAEKDADIAKFSEKTDDPVKNAENEVNLEQAKKDREELNNNLKQLIVEQNENKKEGQVNNGSSEQEPDHQGGQETVERRQVAERPEETDNGTQNVTSGEKTDEERNGLTQSGEASAEPDLKQQDYAFQEQKTGEMGVRQQDAVGERVGGQNESKVPAEQGQEEEKGGKEVKKTILTKRAYEGTVQEDVKKYLEDKGLTRKSFSPQERSKQASDFIDKFGDDAAFQSVKNNDVQGGLASSILAQLQIKNSEAIENLPEDSEERDELAKKHADLIELMEQKGYFSGEYIGQLAHEYQNKGLNFASIKKQVERLTKKPLTAEQTKKIKELTDQNEKLKADLKSHEEKLIEETDKAFKAGVEETKNETKTQKAKRIADKIRAAKIHRPDVFSAATPASVAWDTAVEITAKSVETGGKLADAIQAGIDHIKSTDWYKSLSDSKKEEAENEFKSALGDSDTEEKKINANVKRLETELENLKQDRKKKTPEKREPSEKEKDLMEQIKQEKQRINLETLQKQFVDKKDNKFTHDEARAVWNYMKERYLETGNPFADAISKTSRDLGLTWRQVSEAITTPKVKRVSDEMWKKQSELARQRTAIRAWIGDQNSSAPVKAFKKVANAFRGVAVFGHGGIFVGTHAGMTLFNPQTWNKTIPAFFRGWKYAYGNEANYAKGMEELKNSPNYLLAQRAGLKNEPERITTDEYQKAQHYLGRLGLAGERGFNAIKVLRQDLFDYHYNKLTPEEKEDPEVAKSVAKLVNLATGATTKKLPGWVNELTFAGGMEAARWEKLLESPAKSALILTKVLQGNATPAEKVFAKIWAKRAGTQIATYASLLAANAAIQNQLNPKNPVNFTDPDKPDFGKFKFGETSVDPTSGMRGTAMFLKTLGSIPFKKEQRGETRTQLYGKKLFQYGRGKLSPFYGTVADVITSRDYSGNVLPYSKDKPSKYNHKLGYVEYGTSKLPLPVAESFEVFYKTALDHGASKPALNAIISGLISGTTGFRVSEDEQKKKKNKYSIK